MWPGQVSRADVGHWKRESLRPPVALNFWESRKALLSQYSPAEGRAPYSVCDPTKRRLKEKMDVREAGFTWRTLSPWVGVSFLVWIEFLAPGNVTAKERRMPGASCIGFQVGPAEQGKPSPLIPWDCKIGWNYKCDGLLKQSGTWEVSLRGPTMLWEQCQLLWHWPGRIYQLCDLPQDLSDCLLHPVGLAGDSGQSQALRQ